MLLKIAGDTLFWWSTNEAHSAAYVSGERIRFMMSDTLLIRFQSLPADHAILPLFAENQVTSLKIADIVRSREERYHLTILQAYKGDALRR
jgi:hypothetical protein